MSVGFAQCHRNSTNPIVECNAQLKRVENLPQCPIMTNSIRRRDERWEWGRVWILRRTHKFLRTDLSTQVKKSNSRKKICMNPNWLTPEPTGRLFVEFTHNHVHFKSLMWNRMGASLSPPVTAEVRQVPEPSRSNQEPSRTLLSAGDKTIQKHPSCKK